MQFIMRLLAVGVISVACLAGSRASAAPEDGNYEYALKAAYLLNFLKFVEWPAEVEAKSGPYIVGVLGKDPFGTALDTVMAEKTVRGHAIEIRRFKDVAELSSASGTVHVVYVSPSVTIAPTAVAAAAGTNGVMLVGDGAKFCDTGGAIAFVMIENHLKFDINLSAATGVNLKISSQLLKLANRVVGSVPEGSAE